MAYELTGQDAAEAAKLAEENAKTEEQTQSAFTQYTGSVARLKEAFQSVLETAREAEAVAREANAETQAAESNGVVSVTDAMQLIDDEKQAKKSSRAMSRTAFKQAAMYAVQSGVMGFNAVWESTGDLLGSAYETLTDGDSLKTLVAGGLGGAFLGDSEVANKAIDFAGSFLGLKGVETEPGVEEKHIDGLSTEEEQLAYAAENAGGEPNGYKDPYEGEEAAETKEIITEAKAEIDSSVDALQTSSEDMEKMSHIAETGLDIKGQVKEIGNELENSDNAVVRFIGSAVSSEAVAEFADDVGSAAMKQLDAEVARRDAQAAQQEAAQEAEYGAYT